MNYQFQYNILAHNFSQHQPIIFINDLLTRIVNYHFKSDFPLFPQKLKFLSEVNANPDLVKQKFPGNNNFTYSIFFPSISSDYKKVILLLHGLNERSWEKYLVWARYLAEQTEQPVILFPLAFHMNRSPETWNNPRTMSKVADYRKKHIPGLKDSSYLNAAISTRIENNPEQFFISGMQSYLDVVRFAELIKSGNHPHFQKDTQINICSYSIGAFLSQLIVMDNPLNLFSTTRLCLFCGGAAFDQINGVSRFILDSEAFSRLQSLANTANFVHLKKYFDQLDIPEFENAWETLFYMTLFSEGREQREKKLKQIGERIYAIGLEKDLVVPPSAILKTLKGESGKLPTKVEILNFPYPYTHENPFPVKNEQIQIQVSDQFRLVFDKVSAFLQ